MHAVRTPAHPVMSLSMISIHNGSSAVVCDRGSLRLRHFDAVISGSRTARLQTAIFAAFMLRNRMKNARQGLHSVSGFEPTSWMSSSIELVEHSPAQVQTF
jgi:hypothetical protein